jgi:alpha-L-arabinofuranosidase
VLISMANLELEDESEVVLDLRGGSLEQVEALVLAGDKVSAFNAPAHPDAVMPRSLDVEERKGQLVLRLPAHSFATLRGTLSGPTPVVTAAAAVASRPATGSKPCLNC